VQPYQHLDINDKLYIDDFRLLIAMLLILNDLKIVDGLPKGATMAMWVSLFGKHQSYMSVKL
jgi:hypothetical protein